MASFPFTLLQVTRGGNRPWLHGVRLEGFSRSHAFGLVSLGQPACAHTDMGFSITPGNATGRSKTELGLAPWCYQQRVLALVCPTASGMRGKGDICNHAEGARGWGWAAWGCEETTLPLPRKTWVLPCPAHPTSPSTVPIHSPCLCPGVCFLGPFSLERVQNALPK